jgi:diadenosine tetraphosphate (Ap4A) HIT family hydrolase
MENKAPENCIFCKIAKGEIPSARIWEDEKYIAILDISPNTKGMTLVITKEHFDSYVFDEMPDEAYREFMETAKKVAKMLEKGLSVHRIAMVMEGMGVNHAHIKLYPLHGLEEKFRETWAEERIHFEKYRGYISTQLGHQADSAELNKLAEEIRKKNGI